MTRPKKNVVKYIPLQINKSTTLSMLEAKFGKIAFFYYYKLLAILGSEPGHIYDAREPMKLDYLVLEMGGNRDNVISAIDTLSQWGKIDSDLWSENIIWYQGFVDTLLPAYKRTTSEKPLTKNEAINEIIGSYPSKKHKNSKNKKLVSVDINSHDEGFPGVYVDRNSHDGDILLQKQTGVSVDINSHDEGFPGVYVDRNSHDRDILLQKAPKSNKTKLNKIKYNNNKESNIMKKKTDADLLSLSSLSSLSFVLEILDSEDLSFNPVDYFLEDERAADLVSSYYVRAVKSSAGEKNKMRDERLYQRMTVSALKGQNSWGCESVLGKVRDYVVSEYDKIKKQIENEQAKKVLDSQKKARVDDKKEEKKYISHFEGLPESERNKIHEIAYEEQREIMPDGFEFDRDNIFVMGAVAKIVKSRYFDD